MMINNAYKTFLLSVIVLLAFFCGNAIAYDAAYVVDGVKVDVTADSAAEAREQAFEQAQRKAFNILSKRLLSDDDYATFSPPELDVISSLVLDFEVKNEQLSSVRYVGEYVFRFKKKEIRDYFSDIGAKHTDVSSLPILVIPFYRDENGLDLWSDNNPWKRAWNVVASRRGLVPVTIPIGDLRDMDYINTQKAAYQDWSGVNSMLKRYNTQEALVMIAHPIVGADPQTFDLTINVYSIQSSNPVFVKSFKVIRRGNESDNEIFERAASSIRDRLQKIWKEITMASPDQQTRIIVRVAYRNLEDWVSIKSELQSINSLDSIDILSVTSDYAELSLSFKGDINRLRIALSQRKFALDGPRISFETRASDYSRSDDKQAPLVYDLERR